MKLIDKKTNSVRTILIIALNTLILIVLLEVTSYGILKLEGVDAPLFIDKHTEIVALEDSENFRALDPHLGYGHGDDEIFVKALSDRKFIWRDGFVIYSNEQELERPVILALGGSTTDGVLYSYSWPEELSVLMSERGIAGTVINGGTGGYTTSQELLKLIRDGLEFKPDIVISYSGINDRGKYGKLPYPMVHRYQRELFNAMVSTNNSGAKYLVSTRTLLKRVIDASKPSDLSYTFGIKTAANHAGQYRKNLVNMNAIAEAHGARFFAFIQPFAFYNSVHADDPNLSKGTGYKNAVLDLYSEITRLPEELSYVHDATQMMEQKSGVYKSDSVHLTHRGDKVVANYIYQSIESALTKTQ